MIIGIIILCSSFIIHELLLDVNIFMIKILRSHVFEGFVSSIGCLSESVSKQSSSCLIKWTKEQKSNKNRRQLGKKVLFFIGIIIPPNYYFFIFT